LKGKASANTRILSGVTASAGILLLASLLGYLLTETSARTGFLLQPGSFLFKSFLWGAFYAPIYLFFCTFILMSRPFRRDRLYTLMLSIIPFLTFSFLLKFLFEAESTPIFDLIHFSFGRIPGIALIVLLLGLEIILIYQFHKFLFGIRSPHLQKRRPGLYKRELSFLSKEEDFQSTEPAPSEPLSEISTAASEVSTAENLQNTGIESLPYVPPAEEDAVKALEIYEEQSEGNAEAGEHEEEVSQWVEDADFEKTEPGLPVIEQDESVKRGEDVKRGEPGERFLSYENYSIPITGILHDVAGSDYWRIDESTRRSGEVLMRTLEEFKISAELTGIRRGPVITMFEILPSPGVKLSKIVNLADNIALRLAASRVRIVAPIPGKHAVGIEVPNKERSIVHYKELITLDLFQKSKYEIPIILGVDISGEAQIVDLVQTPHLLIAGATGSGKSVCVNSLLASMLYKRTPEEIRLLLIDPKIVELKFYNNIPHLLTPVVTNPRRSFQALQYCIYEMERRYTLLDSLEVRDIRSYNQKIKKNHLSADLLPYIVIVIDEFADLMATTGKEMETTLARLAAMSRAVGLHLVLATQRPSVDVITGLIKANIPSRIAFMVASKFDSRIIIDGVGAEKLLGRGDMLFTSAWDPNPVRIQGAFLSEEEVEAITNHVKTLGEPDYIDDEFIFENEEEESVPEGEVDPLMEQALDIVIAAGKASASYLQRRLKIGYNRAARMVENMEMMGIVGPPNGSKPREIIHVPDRK
jgi:S-DNA-T family DNA segregation ATPase FtsK/SpoIIIE